MKPLDAAGRKAFRAELYAGSDIPDGVGESIVVELKDQQFDAGGITLAPGKYKVTRIDAGPPWEPLITVPAYIGPWYMVTLCDPNIALVERHDGLLVLERDEKAGMVCDCGPHDDGDVCNHRFQL